MQDTYNPDPAYKQYKSIRNFLRKLDPVTFISLATGSLHKTYQGGVEGLKRSPPWNTLVLIKWCIEQWDDTAHRRREADKADFVRAVNFMHDMDDFLRLPSQYAHISLFMRATAFRQFPLQGEPNLQSLARQEKLFCQLEGNHRFRTEFTQSAGIDYDVFTELGLGLIALILVHPDKIFFREHDFASMTYGISRADVTKFFQHLSATLPQMKQWLQSQPSPTRRDGKRDINLEVMQPSPLFSKPLLQVADRFYIFHRILLVRALETIVHRTLRDAKSDFPAEFGHVFERHIKDCMDDAGVSYVPEKVLQRHLPTCAEPKCVDFAILGGDANIFIDAKGVEVAERKRAAHTPIGVVSSVETSVLKGIRQALITLERSRTLAPSAPFQMSKGETFLIIATYGDLNLGVSRNLGQMLGDEVNEFQKRFGDPLPIPAENIFFLTAADFEFSMALVKAQRTTLLQILLNARQRDAHPHTAKFLFSMHLSEETKDIEDVPMLPMMDAAVDRLSARCTGRFPAS